MKTATKKATVKKSSTKKSATKGKAKNTKAKAKRQPKKSAKRNRVNDDAREVGKHFPQPLTASQVRILRALRDGREKSRGDIKESVGIGRNGLYSQSWLIGLMELTDKESGYGTSAYKGANEIASYFGYIRIAEPTEGDGRGYVHTITAKGKAALVSAEKAAKSAK